VDLARDPSARANLETQPSRSIEQLGFEREPVVIKSFVMQLVGIFAVVAIARIFSKIHQGRTIPTRSEAYPAWFPVLVLSQLTNLATSFEEIPIAGLFSS
jgi:hypothetical protein